jgi:hypothetical protein
VAPGLSEGVRPSAYFESCRARYLTAVCIVANLRAVVSSFGRRDVVTILVTVRTHTNTHYHTNSHKEAHIRAS